MTERTRLRRLREQGSLDRGDLDAMWAGVVPVQMVFGTPVPDTSLRDGIPLPEHVAARGTLGR